jgi:hypothetical protein
MSKPKCPLSRPEVTGIAKRLVTDFAARRDIPLFYKVFGQFPDRPFWLVYNPDFKPDSMVYYLSDHGRAAIQTAVNVFHLDIQPDQTYHLETDKIGSDAQIKTRPVTVANLFK